MSEHNPNTRQCPYCRQWIALQVRQPMRAFNQHKTECAKYRAQLPTGEGYSYVQVIGGRN